MLIEEQPATEQASAEDSRRQGATWELDAVSVARAIVVWVALAVTICIAVMLLLGP